MSNKTSKPKLTADAIIAALDPVHSSLAADDNLRRGAQAALASGGFPNAKAALNFALGWRSGHLEAGREYSEHLANARREWEAEAGQETEGSTGLGNAADAVRKAERERIKTVTTGVPADKLQAGLALALNSDLHVEQLLEVLMTMPVPEAAATPVSRRPLGLVALDPETGEEKILPEGLGAMHYDPSAAKPDPVKAGWKSAVDKVNAVHAKTEE